MPASSCLSDAQNLVLVGAISCGWIANLLTAFQAIRNRETKERQTPHPISSVWVGVPPKDRGLSCTA